MARRSTPKERTAPQEAPPAAKSPRRGNKPKSSQPAEAPPTAAEELTEMTAQPMDSAGADELVETSADTAPSSLSLANADAQAASPAARWDADSGRASFDWPIIEAVAATSGPNQAMAKLLLAARAEGANSRWPF